MQHGRKGESGEAGGGGRGGGGGAGRGLHSLLLPGLISYTEIHVA